MHNKLFKCIAIVLGLFWGLVAYAAEFNATVENNRITFGQSVQLKLELIDAKATSGLDIASLAKDFTIYHQQQYSSYSNVNGTVRAENGWLVTLMPKNPGSYQIPAVSIYTDRGILTSEPIKIEVANAKAGSITDKDNIGISIVATVNKTKAYVNEPIIYTLKIISYKPIANVVLDDVKSNDAIIEKIGDPIQKDQRHGGMLAHIIEIRYAVTALKEGKISIPPVRMNGELQVPVQATRNQRYSLFSNMMFENMMELKPFSLQSEEVSINISPPIGKSTDWLPLQNLNVTQTWDIPSDIKVGDTITRKVKMVGRGGFAKQLPSIKELQIPNVKVYANKPNFSERFADDGNTIVGTREEEFSLVPQTSGAITIPEVQIKWWNLKTKQFEIATLPGKTIDIAELRNDGASVTMDFSNAEPQQVAMVAKSAKEQQQQTILYAIIGVLIGIVVTIILFFTGKFLKKRLQRTTVQPPKPSKRKAITITTVDDLRLHILEHAVQVWHLDISSLNRLSDALLQNNYIYNLELYTALTQAMNDALYADANVDLKVLLEQWQAFKDSVVKQKGLKDKTETPEDYSSLNPT